MALTKVLGAMNIRSIVTKTADYTATINDDLILGNTNAIAITLPSASGNFKPLTISKIGSDTNAITISRAGSDTIGLGVTSIKLFSQGDYIVLVPDGTSKWMILGSNVQIRARYTSASTSIDTSVPIVQNNTKDYDTASAVTTGAAWKFTVPTGYAGLYRVSSTGRYASATIGAGGVQELYAYKNGSIARTLDRKNWASFTGIVSVAGSSDIALAETDYIDLRAYNNTTTALSGDNGTEVCIARIGN